jgi:hypothetical protein
VAITDVGNAASCEEVRLEVVTGVSLMLRGVAGPTFLPQAREGDVLSQAKLKPTFVKDR